MSSSPSSFPSCICSERTLKTRTAYHAEKGPRRFTDGTFLHAHALCLIFKCASQENISARGQAPFFGKGKFGIFKLISHFNKDRKKKENVIPG